MNRRQPRSRREIVESLREMMESDLVEYTKPAGVAVNTSELPSRNSPKPPSPDKKAPSRKGSLVENPLLKNVRFEMEEPAKSKSNNSSRRNSLSNDTKKSSDAAISNSRRGSKENIDKLVSPSPRRQTKKRPNMPAAPPLEKSGSLVLPAIAEAPRELSNLTAASINKGAKEITLKESQSITPRGSHGDIMLQQQQQQQQRRESARGNASAGSGSETSKLEYKRTEVPATSKSPTRLPPLAKPELKKPDNVSPTKWQSALQ